MTTHPIHPYDLAHEQQIFVGQALAALRDSELRVGVIEETSEGQYGPSTVMILVEDELCASFKGGRPSSSPWTLHLASTTRGSQARWATCPWGSTSTVRRGSSIGSVPQNARAVRAWIIQAINSLPSDCEE